MSAADLIARIDAARGDRQRASDLLAEARGMSEPQPEPPQEGLPDTLIDIVQGDFDWGDGRDVGGLFGEVLGGALGGSLGTRGGVALGGLIGPVAAVAGGIILGGVGHIVGSEGGRALGGELGEEIEDLLEGRGFGTGDENSEGAIPAPRTGDPVPVPVIGDRVPGLPTSHYGESRDQTPTNPSNTKAREYDAKVNGNDTGLVVYLDNPNSGRSDKDNPNFGMGDTEFDWVEYGPNGKITLLDAKYAGDSGYYANYPQGSVAQAQKQILAMANSGIDHEKIRIEWRVSTKEAQQALQAKFKEKSIDDKLITVEYYPEEE
ncbi:hypothetical protein C7B65_08075 [Phormidesmis priestleyi ULC007]|uniref:Tox-REase-5 domain-containing protein n=1 Tax=Phormidesmis priestleyi ULC007 TaxID=1920490 RepID=A0A2T1DIU9_9CYAN|nr:hypothetical protein [Phormidesmis priestleyi]PSB20385.1 hypothetical protein C7B65_08075 [Phormidesmis priestleyi ULC007]PZO52962.1 MAG: hypothetical protein DCF14_04905 [Phormidesmis priestleyi]